MVKKPSFWKLGAAVFGILLVVIVFLNLFDSVDIFGEKHGLGTIMLCTLLLYTAASLRIVGPKELGCVLIFGRPLKNVSSGLAIVPLWICTLVTETRLVIQDELPAEPELEYIEFVELLSIKNEGGWGELNSLHGLAALKFHRPTY